VSNKASVNLSATTVQVIFFKARLPHRLRHAGAHCTRLIGHGNSTIYTMGFEHQNTMGYREKHMKSMGISGSIYGGTLVPYVWPYFVVIFNVYTLWL
jgi:hypothetical protein